VDATEQQDWLREHIPHRLRAAIARLDYLSELLGTQTPGDSTPANDDFAIRRRCEFNAINEGRLISIRWLIEFVWIKSDQAGASIPCPKSHPTDVRIEDIAGGVRIDSSSKEAGVLAAIWKGCSQASSHATNAYSRPDVNEPKLNEAMKIIWAHLRDTIYKQAGLNIKDIVLKAA